MEVIHMPRKLTNEEFISQCKQTHGDTYDYSHVDYKGKHELVDIGCLEHGIFSVRATSFIRRIGKCPKCSPKPRYTLETFIQKANEIHNNQYDYSHIETYDGYESSLPIYCNKHKSFFMQSPRNHIQGKCGCPECGNDKVTAHGIANRTTPKQFMLKSVIIHNNKYDYSKVVYINSKTKVEIVCPRHGSFLQTPDNHINKKQGCPKCFDEDKRGGLGGYSEGWFVLHPERKEHPAQLYVLEMECGSDHFIKVGITINTIKHRYSRAKQSEKHIKKTTILAIPLSLYEAFQLEQQILHNMREFKYYPNYFFDGRTECLQHTPAVINEVTSLINIKTNPG